MVFKGMHFSSFRYEAEELDQIIGIDWNLHSILAMPA